MRRYALLIISLLALVGCIKEQSLDDSFRYRLVVDGRIEQGRGAVVMLSQSMPYMSSYDEDTYRKLAIWGAKVTIIHGEERSVLTSRRDSHYPTEYVYTGYEIMGEVGESYTIEIEYSGRSWRAEGSILPPIELHDIEVVAEGEDKYSIKATLPPSPYPCSIDCSIDGSTYYAPTILGIYAPSDSERRITINPPSDKLMREGYSIMFSGKERVTLRVNTLCDFGYTYWRKWEDNFINSVNPIFPSTSNLPTNISNDGMGIWSGYGTTYYPLGVLNKVKTASDTNGQKEAEKGLKGKI